MIDKDRGVLAVVVTYNRLELLKQCIGALEAQTVGCDILLVDNASTDGTEAFAKGKEGSGFFYARMEENLGGAGGFHYGIKRGTEMGYEQLWIMDDDCIPTATALEGLLEAGKRMGNEYGWLSSMAVWTDGSLCGMNRQKKTPFQDVHDEDFRKDRIPCQIASFVCLLLPRESVIKYGLPIREFFIWTDDWEYTRRISMHEPCYVIPASKAVHAMKQNTVSNIAHDSPDRLSRYRYMYRNEVYVYRREGIKGWLWLIAKDCWHAIRTIAAGHPGRVGIIFEGFRNGLKFRPEAEMIQQGEA